MSEGEKITVRKPSPAEIAAAEARHFARSLEGPQGIEPIFSMTFERRLTALPLHRTEAGSLSCSTCDGGGCLDCTDPS